MFKSTTSRRIQVSSTNVPEGKSAMLPLPQSVAADRLGSPSEETASGGGTPAIVHGEIAVLGEL